MKLAAIMLAAVAAAVGLVSGSLTFVTSPAGTSPAPSVRNALAKTTASRPTSPRSVGNSPVGPLNVKIVVGEEEKHFETTAEKKKRKKVENLRKEKIQRARERKFKKNKF